MASQITSLTIAYPTVYSRADQRNIKVPRRWTLCGEFIADRRIPRTKGQWRGKCFHLMTSSCVHTNDYLLCVVVFVLFYGPVLGDFIRYFMITLPVLWQATAWTQY